MGKKAKQAITLLAKIAVAAGLIAWFVHKGMLDLTAISGLLAPWPALVLLAAAFFQIYFNNIRWLYLLNAQGLKSTIHKTLSLSLIGVFFNYAMPGGVGGDVVKGFYLLQDHPQQKAAGVISIFMDRFIGFSVMIFTAALALLFHWDRVQENAQIKTLSGAVFLLSFAFIGFYLFALSKKLKTSRLRQTLFSKIPLGQHIEKIYSEVHAYRNDLRALAFAFLFSFASQFFLVGVIYFIGNQLDFKTLHFTDYAFLVPLGTVAMALPISPAGIGVGQAAFYFLFNLYLGQKTSLGPTAATALQISQLAWGFVGAFFYLRRKQHAN